VTVGVTQWGTRRTSRSRHLLSLLSSDSVKFHMTKDPSNVCLIAEPVMFQPVSHPIRMGLASFDILLQSAAVCLSVNLPKGRRDWVITFHTVDLLDDLGARSTPMVQQLRAGSYEACILTTSANSG